MNNKKNIKLLLFLGVPLVLMFILLRFFLYFRKSDGFSGLPILLPILLLCFLLFALCTSGFFAAWVYQDCKKRGDDPILWAIVTFLATPFIGLLLYFLRRSEIKQSCPVCGHQISLHAKYCEGCGTHMDDKEDTIMGNQTHHLKLIAAGIFSTALMLVCLTGFIVKAADGSGINTDITSNESVWNFGTISMNYNAKVDGIWKLDFKSASKGFVKQEDMTIQNADTQMLYADISCGTIPDNATLVLWLVQGEISRSVDVTNLSRPLEYPLKEFENGKIHIRLQINGVKNTTSKIYIH